jgi:predicted PolB exonuclease-like 3'-5' exonuclease
MYASVDVEDGRYRNERDFLWNTFYNWYLRKETSLTNNLIRSSKLTYLFPASQEERVIVSKVEETITS